MPSLTQANSMLRVIGGTHTTLPSQMSAVLCYRPLLQVWTEWPPAVELPFKLQWASGAIGVQQQLAPTEINFLFTPSKAISAIKVPGNIGSAPVQFLVDSGAAILVAQFDVIPDPLHTLVSYSSDITAVPASGHLLDVVGRAALILTVGHIELKHEFTNVRSQLLTV